VIHSATFWVLMFTAAGLIFILPIIIGLIRRIERMEVVVLLNIAAMVTGLTWFGAIALVFILPRRLPAGPGYVTPPGAPVMSSGGYWPTEHRRP
jgi:hypothetical protein